MVPSHWLPQVELLQYCSAPSVILIHCIIQLINRFSYCEVRKLHADIFSDQKDTYSLKNDCSGRIQHNTIASKHSTVAKYDNV